jgi:DNA-binding SARP family transcriptional activator
LAVPTTRIQLCGQIAVILQGQRVDAHLPGRQGARLLAYLVLNRGRPVGREELIDALWPESPPAGADAGLRSLLSKLRAVLGSTTVEGRGQIRLRLPADARVDTEDAHVAIHRAEAAVGQNHWAEAWAPSRVALIVSRRGFLPGASAPWIDAQRADLGDIERRALRCVAISGAELGGLEAEAGERAARRLVVLGPLDEGAHRCLIQVLVARGEPAGALTVYDDLRRRLREGLGASPGPETRALHDQVLQLTGP